VGGVARSAPQHAHAHARAPQVGRRGSVAVVAVAVVVLVIAAAAKTNAAAALCLPNNTKAPQYGPPQYGPQRSCGLPFRTPGLLCGGLEGSPAGAARHAVQRSAARRGAGAGAARGGRVAYGGYSFGEVGHCVVSDTQKDVLTPPPKNAFLTPKHP